MIGRNCVVESIVSAHVSGASPTIYAGGDLRGTGSIVDNVVLNEDKLLTPKIRGLGPRTVTISFVAPPVVEYQNGLQLRPAIEDAMINNSIQPTNRSHILGPV
jgi:hypothetical protein